MHEPSLKSLPIAIRVRLHLPTGLAVVFLSVYGKVVCPFMDSLSWGRIISVLLVVAILQIFGREWLFRRFPSATGKNSVARHGYKLMALSWLAAGLLASLIHATLYAEFPWGSHMKLLSGYWGLGAALLAQLEYVILENHFRALQPHKGLNIQENLTTRLMEGTLVVSLAPVIVMILVSFRFVYEGFTDRGSAVEILFLGGVFVLTGLFTSWQYANSLRQDCTLLLDTVQQIAHGHFQLNIDDSRPDELGHVATGINEMARGLALRERIREAFGRFVNPQVAQNFIENFADDDQQVKMGGQRREVAILMADIRDFTPMSEELEPEQITSLLNDYFSKMVAAIQTHGGMVDKFIGDAVMAVFGLTENSSGYCEEAVAAALAMREGLVQFNEEVQQQYGRQIANGIGIHVGEVVAGYIGSADRLEFTVIGHPVNLAARIESQAKPPNPPILFSAAVNNRLSERFETRMVLDAHMKGITGSVALFTVAPFSHMDKDQPESAVR